MQFNFKNWSGFFKKTDLTDEEIFEIDESKNAKNNSMLQKKSNLKKWIFILLGLISCVVTLKIVKVSSQSKQKPQEYNKENMAIKTAQESIETEKGWLLNLQGGLKDEGETRVKQVQSLETQIAELKKEVENSEKTITNVLSDKLKSLESQLQNLQIETAQIKKNNAIAASKVKDFAEVSVKKIESTTSSLSQDISWYIPASTYVAGNLLNGIAASTAITAQSDPTPVIIRLTDLASLPGNFTRDLKDCRVLASCVGDLSSERVNIRLEKLTCVDRTTKKAIETIISGFVVGSDGIAGIKGRVVSMDGKFLQHAAVGGLLGGISSMLQHNRHGQKDQVNINLGNKEVNDSGGDYFKRFVDGTSTKVSAISDNLMEYYIKKAESIQPVIEVPSGAKVEIVFLQGVFFGSKNVKSVIEKERQ